MTGACRNGQKRCISVYNFVRQQQLCPDIHREKRSAQSDEEPRKPLRMYVCMSEIRQVFDHITGVLVGCRWLKVDMSVENSSHAFSSKTSLYNLHIMDSQQGTSPLPSMDWPKKQSLLIRKSDSASIESSYWFAWGYGLVVWHLLSIVHHNTC